MLGQRCVWGRSLSTIAGMPLRHEAAPLLASALAFIARDQAPFYSPGHKGGRSLDPALRASLAELDLNNLPDTDTLHCPTGAIREAETLLSDAYGVDHSYMLVGGSTSGNIAAILSTVRPGQSFLVQRNAHKSVIAGIIHAGAVPIWLMPEHDADFGIALGVSAPSVDAAFRTHPEAQALFALNPTYFGTTPDIAALAAVCRAHGKLLLVDEAHGPHFHFCPALFPRAAEDVGADAVVQSSHKILSALSQAAVLHTCGPRIDPAIVRKVLQLIQTTSPNFAIMASIDTARRQMMLEGKDLLQAAIARARHAREALSAMPGIAVLGRSQLRGPGSGFHDLDETKIVLRVDELGLTGYELQRLLNSDYGIQPELGGEEHVLFILTLANTDADVARLLQAMSAIARAPRVARRARDRLQLAFNDGLPVQATTPREAFYARAEDCAFEAAAGRICAEVVTPYPPGIPVLMPGERISRDLLAGLLAVKEARCPISASDPALATLRVLA
jgi:arginine/lysine/ornithine decarboxylase